MDTLSYLVQLFRPDNFEFITKEEGQLPSLYFKDHNLNISGSIHPQNIRGAAIEAHITEQIDWFYYGEEEQDENSVPQKLTWNFTEGYILYQPDNYSKDNSRGKVYRTEGVSFNEILEAIKQTTSNEGYIKIDGVESFLLVNDLYNKIKQEYS